MAPMKAWNPPARSALLLCGAVALLGVLGGRALGQFGGEPRGENPVFVDESPAAVEGLARIGEHAAAGNFEQAVRTAQKLLDEHGGGFVASASDADLFTPVRSRVVGVLKGDARLLSRYREWASPGAQQMLESRDFEGLHAQRSLTAQGMTGTLALARRRVLDGQIDDACMLLLELADHPDRASRAKELAGAAALAARYQVRAEVRRGLAGLVEGGSLPEVDGAAAAASAVAPSLGAGSGSPLADDVVNQPLGTGVFGDASLPIQPARWNGDESVLNALPRFAREMRYWPAVGERAVFFSNGQAVTALDRVSMRRLWSVDAADLLKLPADEQDRGQNGLRHPAQTSLEEVVQPVLAAGNTLLLAVVGRDYETTVGAEGAEYLTAFDARTGAVRYSVALRSLDPQLSDCYARGPLVSDGRVVVVNLLKRQNQRRVLASVLVGIEATTGKRLWTRVVGSSGVLPFYRAAALTDSTVAADGVVYRYDRLGVVGAYAIADGRPLWVRRLGSKVMLEMPPAAEPWLVHSPVVTRAGVVALTPERDEVLVLDAGSGVVTARRLSADFGAPEYLTATGSELVAVGRSALSTVRLDQIETGAVRRTGVLGGGGDAGGIRGRVTAAGGTLLVPTSSGVVVLDAAAPEKPVRTVALDAPGSPLSLPEGLLVVDDARAHTYCTWAVAAEHLRAQIAAAPADAGPATELVVLAERAGKPGDVLAAADSALGALARETEGDAARNGELRSSLVATLLRAVERSIGGRVEQPGATLDDAGVDGALERAGRAAHAPADRAAVLLAAGGVSEHRGAWGAAAESYQRVLSEEGLAAAGSTASPGGSTAGSVAVERLVRVVKAGGRGAYGAFDAEFTAARDALGPGGAAPVDKLEALAARYPLAREGPSLWLLIAQRVGGDTPQGKRAQARALERGVQAAERAGDAEASVVGELNGGLVRNLLDRSLLAAAADALARASSRFPGVALTSGGAALPMDQARALIERSQAGARRWPRVGAPAAGRAPQVIDGWVLMEPLIRPGGGPGGGAGNQPFLVMHKGDERRTQQVALFGLRQGQLAGEAAEGAVGALTELWFSRAGGDAWTLVCSDARGALFFVGEQNGGRLARVDAESGKVAWQTEPFGSLFPADPPTPFGNPATAPQRAAIGGELRSTGEIVLATDGRTICMVERAGRCAAVDADGGQVLWTARLPITRIADATVSGGQLIAVGEYAEPQADNRVDRVALLDARTGTRLAVAPAPLTGVRYMRTTSRGDLILGAGGTIAAVSAADLETGRPAWTLTGHRAAGAWEAWLLDDRLFLLADDRTLWEVPAGSGAAPAQPIDTMGRLDGRTSIAVWQTGSGGVAFASGRGVVLIDGKGATAGADPINAPDGTVLPAVVEGGAVLLTQEAQRQGFAGGETATGAGWSLHRVETGGGRLVSTTPVTFSSAPLRVAAIDGRIAVSTAAGTVVFDAPAEPR